jgi:hypothetical protein
MKKLNHLLPARTVPHWQRQTTLKQNDGKIFFEANGIRKQGGDLAILIYDKADFKLK